ncbi:MAG TPA: hypothetical protein IAB50_12725 [Candidatus Faecivicinus avistercoris]|nr:hypothetical protein [Candidatus Faecivicinus avistercoris]
MTKIRIGSSSAGIVRNPPVANIINRLPSFCKPLTRLFDRKRTLFLKTASHGEFRIEGQVKMFAIHEKIGDIWSQKGRESGGAAGIA